MSAREESNKRPAFGSARIYFLFDEPSADPVMGHIADCVGCECDYRLYSSCCSFLLHVQGTLKLLGAGVFPATACTMLKDRKSLYFTHLDRDMVKACHDRYNNAGLKCITRYGGIECNRSATCLLNIKV